MFCKECQTNIDCGAYLGPHLKAHNMSILDYAQKHGENPWDSSYDSKLKNHSKYHKPMDIDKLKLKATIFNVEFPLYTVPSEVCLPAPEHYKVPQKGLLGEAVKDVLLALKHNRSVLIHGPAGTGKDSIFHYVSAYTQRPGMCLSIKPGTDIRSWFFTREFDQNGTRWEEGPLLKALVNGYTLPNGDKVPYLIILSDFDRADRSQAEYMRLIMDSIQGRVEGPQGNIYKVLPGTCICATANSAGGGDTSGRYTSSNVIDASILDRFQRVFCFDSFIEWEEEEEILKQKFPKLVAKHPKVFQDLGPAVAIIRSAISKNELYGELSHRGICAISSYMEDWVLEGSKKNTLNLIKDAIVSWTYRLPDKETREQALTLVNPQFKTITR